MDKYDVKNLDLAEGGRRRIEWAEREMSRFVALSRNALPRNAPLRVFACPPVYMLLLKPPT